MCYSVITFSTSLGWKILVNTSFPNHFQFQIEVVLLQYMGIIYHPKGQEGMRAGQEITAHGVTNIGGRRLGGGSSSLGRSSPQGRVASYYGGGRAVAKSVSRSPPGTYQQWYGQKELIHPTGTQRHKKEGKNFAPEQTRQYQSQQWINANYGDRSVGHFKGLQVRLGGDKRSLTRAGQAAKARGRSIQPHHITKTWHEPAPEGMVAGKWYNPADLTYTAKPGSNRHVGIGDSAWYGGIITGVKPEIIARQKALASKRQRQASLVAAEKAKIAHAKAETIRLKKQAAAAKAATAKHQQQLIIDKKKHDAQVIENKRLQVIEDKRLARQSKRRKHFTDSEQYAVTKPKKRPLPVRRNAPGGRRR